MAELIYIKRGKKGNKIKKWKKHYRLSLREVEIEVLYFSSIITLSKHTLILIYISFNLITQYRNISPSREREEEEEEEEMESYVAVKNFDEDVEMGNKKNEISESRSVMNNGEKTTTCFSSSSKQQRQPQTQTHRLVSLDVFRGLTVGLMILVDEAGGLLPGLNHSPWNGLTLADLVMPFFLFIVGVSLALAYKKLSSRVVASRKAILRALKLLALGLFIQGGYFHRLGDLTFGVDLKQLRWMGILQRIAIAYLFTALCEIWLKADNIVNSGSSLIRKYRYQWAVALFLSGLYICLLYGLYVPDWEYQIPTEPSSAPMTLSVKCGVRGDTGPACNAVGMIDRTILGIQHLYKRPTYARTPECSINSPNHGPLPPDAPAWCQAAFDPEGLLSSVMAIVTCLVGLHFGHIIVHFKDHRVRILYWMIPTSCFVVFGLTLYLFGMDMNKVLYSFSYTCVTAGAAGFLFVGTYLMVDVCGYSRLTMIFQWMGKHALMIYILVACNVFPVLIQGFYWGKPQTNILKLIGVGT